jgi:hypothetical protein
MCCKERNVFSENHTRRFVVFIVGCLCGGVPIYTDSRFGFTRNNLYPTGQPHTGSNGRTDANGRQQRYAFAPAADGYTRSHRNGDGDAIAE